MRKIPEHFSSLSPGNLSVRMIGHLNFAGMAQIFHILRIDEMGAVNPDKAMRLQHFIIQLEHSGHNHRRPVRKVDAGIITLRF
jgi:hypothetical protein